MSIKLPSFRYWMLFLIFWSNFVFAARESSFTLEDLSTASPWYWVLTFAAATIGGIVSILIRLSNDAENDVHMKSVSLFFASNLLSSYLVGFVGFAAGIHFSSKPFLLLITVALLSFGGAKTLEAVAGRATEGFLGLIDRIFPAARKEAD